MKTVFSIAATLFFAITSQGCSVNIRSTTFNRALASNGVARSTNHLVFSTEPAASTTAGLAIGPSVQVSVVNQNGVLVTTDNSTVSLSLGSNPGSATLQGTLSVNAVNGVATFSNLVIDQAANGYVFLAQDTGAVSGTSSSFDIVAAGAAQLGFVVQPTNSAVAGVNISPAIVVMVEDQFGNLVETSSAAVTLTVQSSPSEGSLSGTITVNASSGIATFSGVSVDVAGNGYTLGATANGVSGTISSAFNVGLAANTDQILGSDAPGYDAVATSSVSDSSGNLYVAGYVNVNSVDFQWIVRKLSGGVWSTIDYYSYPDGYHSLAYSIGIDSAQNIYVGGNGEDDDYNNHWIVRKFSGGVWTTIDDYVYNSSGSPTNVFVSSIASDSSGNIYVAGTVQDTSNVLHWLVRKYSSGTWTTIDDYQYASGQSAQGSALVVDSTGNLYATGEAADNSGINHWVVRKMTAGSWSTLDDYQYVTGYSSQAVSIQVDSSNNVYVTGDGSDSSGVNHWLSRKYSSGSWSQLDDYVYTAGKNANSSSFQIDASGNYFTAGFGYDSSNILHWLVRKYSAGTWSTIDDYQYAAGISTFSDSIAINPSSGNVYVMGGDYDGSAHHWLVREYAAGNWSTIDNYQFLTGSAAGNALASDSAGNLFAAGAVNGKWTVRESTGGVWNTIDTYSGGASANSLALDTSGNLYVTGSGQWLVRMYSGGSWSTLDNYVYPSGSNTFASSLTVDSLGNVYVTGTAEDSSYDSHWITREYSAGTWTTIDDYQYPSGYGDTGVAMTFDSSGNLYVTGNSVDSSSQSHWITREYSVGTWTTIDDYQYPSGTNSLPSALIADSSGNIYAAGRALDSSYISHWIIREFSSGNWSTIQDYQYVSNESSQANALAIDPSGNIYAAGSGADSAGVNHWLVRKYNGSTWTTVQDYQLASGLPAQANGLTFDHFSNQLYATGIASSAAANSYWTTLLVP